MIEHQAEVVLARGCRIEHKPLVAPPVEIRATLLPRFPRRLREAFDASFSRLETTASGSASRTSGRYAVGLRPILDPETSPRRAQTTSENNEERSTGRNLGLDRHRSFRNDTATPGEDGL
jgi:hypothetical protein